MSTSLLRVIKLGGSLLDWAGLNSAWSEWQLRQPPGLNAIVMGGGKPAQWVREADGLYHLGEQTAHWLCIRAMQLNAELLAASWRVPLAATANDWSSAWQHNRFAILEPWTWLREIEPRQPGRRLPAGWSVTSDSIAARFAQVQGAQELVLLKSCLPHEAISAPTAVACGLVDRDFPTSAAGQVVRVVNLRAAGQPERRWPAPVGES